jgi:flagellar biosynthesis protein FlhG
MQNFVPRIWAIGGGKGGTGKSFFTGSLGFLLAEQGHRTVMVDLDLGAANLHTLVGLPHPERGIADFLHRRVADLAATIVPTPHPRLGLISGAMNNLDMPNIPHEQKMKLMRHLTRLPCDYVLLDLGAGTAYNTIDFFMIADLGIFVTTPEPTAIENIYRLIRSVYIRKIHQILKTHHFKLFAKEAEAHNPLATVSNPDVLLEIIARLDPEKSAALEAALEAFEFKLAINQLHKRDSRNIGPLICNIVGKHLGMNIEPLGNIIFDDRVHHAVCNRVPFLKLYPYAQTATQLRECCRQLLAANGAASAFQRVVN